MASVVRTAGSTQGIRSPKGLDNRLVVLELARQDVKVDYPAGWLVDDIDDAINQMFFVPAYPFWSLTIIAIDVVALWALCVYGSGENLAA